MKNKTMIIGKIENASVEYVSDHDYWTCKIGIYFDGFYQNFGCLMLNKDNAYKFGEMIYYLFNPFSNEKFLEENSRSLFDSLIGKECYGLWSLGDHNEPMAGIQTLDQKRFTISGFQKKFFPKTYKSALDRKRESIQSTINCAKRRLNEAKQELKTFESRWTDWGDSI